MKMEQLKIPVLFLVFNRPETTRRVFEAIRSAKPCVLYVAADGPRRDRVGELLMVEQVRQIALAVDWPCDVKTLFRDENLGCRDAVSSAINWFFENVEQGIVLEDDCVPSPSFFEYCEVMLTKYKLDREIGMISGFNPLGAGISTNEYFKSINPSIWGWATWRDRWQGYDKEIKGWDQEDNKRIIRNKLTIKAYYYYSLCFDLVSSGILNTWDYQWTFYLMANNMLTIKTKSNCITNVGTEGVHANGADQNHNILFGNIDAKQLVYNKSEGRIQDELFYKSCLPSMTHILIKKMINKIGYYQRAKDLSNSIKKFLRK